MSGRGVPDYMLAQNMQSMPMHMSRLQISMDEKREARRESRRQVNNSRVPPPHAIQSHFPPSLISGAAPTYRGYIEPGSHATRARSQPPSSLPPKPLKSSLKTAIHKQVDQETLKNKEGHSKAFGSPNSSLESISEKSEPEELPDAQKNTGTAHVVLAGQQNQLDAPVKPIETLQVPAQLYSDKSQGSDDEDNVPLAALARRDMVNRPNEKGHQQPSKKIKERTRSVSFSAYAEYIPNENDISEDDSSSIYSSRRTYSCDNVSELSERMYDLPPRNPSRHQNHDVPSSYSRREASPHPKTKVSVHKPSERKAGPLGYQASHYPDEYYSENMQPISNRYGPLPAEQFFDTIPHTAYRNREHMNSAHMLNNAYFNDPYYAGYNEPSDDYFDIRRQGYENTVYSSLSRTSGMRSASSTTSLPGTMFSYANYESQSNLDPLSHRTGYRGFHEGHSRSYSISQGTGGQFTQPQPRTQSVSRSTGRHYMEPQPRSVSVSRSSGRYLSAEQPRSPSVSRAPTSRMQNMFSPDLGRPTNSRSMNM
ncbi:hypothetical protein K493DRAFT_310081 [Basidiobolus meristosporus CBS 931.73]|uniref:Uncharacterized protein n=1 Tax=Basidiobolus meristosporus CBS 931.73 TaxID=1314790 RepID=A0A1Y1ZCA1_9FUNG|nr:hypothetical protein K493DRAFT_310081 [Basidiobolus meristosporus CBS 931.73]|eukprot:ORY07879.1 hypothetical protein K493DRAFT_310081 [Basidiobolus meristosporus CBS 931.73]